MKLRAATLLAAAGLCVSLPALAAPQTTLPAKNASAPIELHIEAQAEVVPDRIELDFAVSGNGATAAEAEAALEINRKALLAKLGELGVDTSKLSFVRDTESELAVSAAMDAAKDQAVSEGRKKAQGNVAAQSYVLRRDKVSVQLPDQASLAALYEWSAAEGAGAIATNLSLSSSDPAKARHQAREKAVVKARHDADEYAALMGYHVVRVVRVSNARPVLNLPDVVDFVRVMEKSGWQSVVGSMSLPPVETVAIDFVIAPN